MKKLLIIVLGLLISGTIQAQENKVMSEKRSFIALHGGISLPVGDFASQNINNEYAAFAKTGFNIGLNYGYMIKKPIGIAAGIFYNSYPASKLIYWFDHGFGGESMDLNLDHWKFYGIAAGPMLSVELTPAIQTDLRVMGGIANANAPKVSYQTEVISEGDWSTAAVFNGGLNVRIQASNNFFVFANADYNYLKPKFHYNYTDEFGQRATENFEQKISSIGITAGVGIKF